MPSRPSTAREPHLNLARRFVDRLVAADGDEAGQSAAEGGGPSSLAWSMANATIPGDPDQSDLLPPTA